MQTYDATRKGELGVAALTGFGMVLLIAFVTSVGTQLHPPAPILQPIAVLPDFAAINQVDVKKQQFFDYLEDYIVAENEAIAAIRSELQAYAGVVASGAALSPRERDRVMALAELYRIETEELSERGIMDVLMRRVDVLPVSLALAQAANESAWGTSRFTLEGNNLFGQWCYEEGCGIIPRRRRDGATHEVKKFNSIAEAIEAYLLNINTHPSYRELRDMRETMRRRSNKLDPVQLALGLAEYSERGENYVDEVQTIIEQNNLQSRDQSAYY